MNATLDNYINGNLADAKRQAKRFGYMAIVRALVDDYGYTQARAAITAAYLKGRASFQQACDAEAAR